MSVKYYTKNEVENLYLENEKNSIYYKEVEVKIKTTYTDTVTGKENTTQIRKFADLLKVNNENVFVIHDEYRDTNSNLAVCTHDDIIGSFVEKSSKVYSYEKEVKNIKMTASTNNLFLKLPEKGELKKQYDEDIQKIFNNLYNVIMDNIMNNQVKKIFNNISNTSDSMSNDIIKTIAIEEEAEKFRKLTSGALQSIKELKNDYINKIAQENDSAVKQMLERNKGNKLKR